MVYSRIRKHISAKDLRESLTLKFREELNPKFWNGESLKPEVKTALLNFASAFAEYVELPEGSIRDVLLLGGNAGYNYTPHSDLDVHLVVDPKYIPECDADLLDDYYMDKKTLWELTHDVKIYGVDAEPYIERPGITRKKSQGVYSLIKNKFIQEPQKFEGELDEADLERKVNNYAKKLDKLIDSNNGVGMRLALKKLKNMRAASLTKFGEYGFENMMFKELRNRGYIDRVRKAMLELKSKNLSLV